MNESALASACMLHTSAASLTSDSSSSLRRSRLGGIAEDIEEGTTAPLGKTRNLTTPERLDNSDVKSGNDEKGNTSAVAAVIGPLLPKQEEATAPKELTSLPARVDSRTLPKTVSLTGVQADNPSVHSPQVDKSPSVHSPQDETSSAHSPRNQNPSSAHSPRNQNPSSAHSPRNQNPSSPTLSFNKPLPAPPESTLSRKPLDVQPLRHVEEKGFDYQSHQSHDMNRPSFDHHQSSQTLRPPVDDGASQYSAYKPKKKKLGPRPHKESEGRPKTSGAASKDQRAIANLPTNLRISNRAPSTSEARPGSQHSSRSVPSNFRHHSELSSVMPPPLPQPASHIAELYQPTDAGSFISTTALNPQKGPSVTPEKLRLMKALQMRKKQQALAKRASMAPSGAEVATLGAEKMATGEGELESGKPSDCIDAHTSDFQIGQDAIRNNLEKKPNTEAPPSSNNTEIHASVSALREDEHPSPSLVAANIIPTKELQKELPVKKDSGISPSADAETSMHDSFVVSSTPQQTPDVLNNTKKPGPKQADSEAVPSNVGGDSKLDKLKSPVITLSISPTPIMDTSPDQVQSVRNKYNLINDTDADRSVSDYSQAATPERNRKRRALVEPIKVVSSPEASDVSDDDSFVEELQHAKLEQAKPISVARSPITPIFKNSSDRPGEVARAASASMQVRSENTSPFLEKPRAIGGPSTSTALPLLPPVAGDAGYALAAKKGTVSSGITTRIKALESFSRREASASPPRASPPQPIGQKSSPSLWSFKKRASFAPSRPNLPNIPNIPTSKIAPGQLPTPQPTPPPEPTPSSPTRPWLQRNGSATQIDAPMQKGDSISVTARIIRDPNLNPAEPVDTPSELVPMNLHRSPLTIEHERSEPSQSQSVISSSASTVRPDSSPTSPRVERTRFSFSSTRSSVPKLPTSDSMTGRMSQAGSHKNKTSASLPLSHSDPLSLAEDKPKESRTSRLMKRMSNLTGGPRRNIFTSLSPNGREQTPPAPIVERRESQTELSSLSDSLSHVIDIGDVNVQFPDTLLWKRRFMRIDDQGYLVLTPPTKETMERNRGISRRFHLSEFKMPTLPDPEREELPWSILLDFEDGTCLQCACESRYAQTQVLRSTSPCVQGFPKPTLTLLPLF